MKMPYIFVTVIACLWLYYIVVTEPPYGLDRTPRTHDEITLQRVRHQYPRLQN
ncbi:MAG: hypothetical protein OXB96_00810 [Candidatus Kaiserbacteria bacterium]|nr:hypothetical protein [Candidatus Kaiserbacteria bacterium]